MASELAERLAQEGVLPRTWKLIENEGGKPLEPASVLATLNPAETDDSPLWKERRVLLNSILARNFAPFRYELLRTESWLSVLNTYSRIKSTAGHGQIPVVHASAPDARANADEL